MFLRSGSLYSGFFQQLIADNDSWSHKILMRKSPSISFSNVCMREDPRSLGRSYSIVDFVSIVIFDWSICARFLFGKISRFRNLSCSTKLTFLETVKCIM